MAIQIKRKHILDQAIDSSKVDSSIALSADLAAEQAARIAADSAEQAARIAADSAEQAAREAADLVLQGNVDSEQAAREAADSAEQAAREAADSAEQAAREAADSAEQAAREAADLVLQGNVDSEETRAMAAEAALASDLADEVARATAADLVLQGNIDAEKARIDAILLASDADKDSFAEIVDLINSVDTTNDQAFAGYVLSNDAALAQEVSDRQSADSAEQAARIAADSAEQAAREAADLVLQGNIDSEQAARIAADSAEQAAREAADLVLQGNVDSEQAAREAADSAEQAARIAEDLTFVKLDGSREMTGDLHMGHAAVVAPPSSGGTLVGMQQLVPPSQIANIMISGMGENGQFYIIGSSSDWQSRYLALSSNEGQSYTVLDAGNWDSADGFIEDVKINAAGIIFVKKAINNSMDRILLYSLDNGQTFLPGGLPSDFGGNFEFVTSGPDLILTHGIQNPDTGNVNYKIQRTSDFGATYSLINSTENVPELQTLTIQVSGSTLAFTHWDGVLQRQKLSFSINGGNSFQSVDFGPNNGFTLKDSNHVIVGRQPSDWTQPVSFDSVNLNTLVATSLDGFNAVVADLKQAGKMLYIRGFSGGKFFANAMGMMMDNTLYHGADIDAVSVVAGEGSGSSAGQSTPAVYHSIKYVADGVDAHDATTKGQLDSEVSRAQSVENSLQSQINSESSSRLSADQQLQSNIDAEASSRQAADLAEQAARIAEDLTLVKLDGSREMTGALKMGSVSAGTEVIVSGGNIALPPANQGEPWSIVAPSSIWLDTIDGYNDSYIVRAYLTNLGEYTAPSERNPADAAFEYSPNGGLTVLKSSISVTDVGFPWGNDYLVFQLAGVNDGTYNDIIYYIYEVTSGSTVKHKITHLANGVDAHDAVTKGQLDSEQAAREAADLVLQGNIDAEKARIDAILSASTADKDSFAEIVDLINSVDTTNDQAFAGYVLSNDAALAAEQARALAAESALQSSLNQEIADRISDVNAEETRALAAEAALQSGLNQEISDRQAAIAALSSSSENLDGYAQDVRSDLDAAVAALEAADAALDARLDTLEAAPVLSFDKEQFTAASPLTDIVLAKEVIEKSLVVHVGRLALHAGQDYSISVVAGKTKLTWIGDFAVGGVEGIEVGDQIYVTYHYWA